MPNITSTFESSEPDLQGLLSNIGNGNIQLPDFQRSWVWDDDHIRSLIASVSLSYPIGAIMLLETGGKGVQFHPRAIEGAQVNPDVTPEVLILDGQQRLTSLFLAIVSGQPVPTTKKKKKIERFYYLDMMKCLDSKQDRIDAIISIPSSKLITSDFGRKIDLNLSTRDNEYNSFMFPLGEIFDSNLRSAWRRNYSHFHNNEDTQLDIWDRFEEKIVSLFLSYRIPVIKLLKDTPKEAVCQVFEKVNMGGVTLTVFELVTAMFAAENYNLREDWEKRKTNLEKHKVLEKVDSTTFLTATTLLASSKRNIKDSSKPITCKKKDVLNLTLAEYKANADGIEEGLRKAVRFLAREKVFDARSLPYSTQLIPLAVICSLLGDDFEKDTIRGKMAQWYWSGIFGELYGGANETRFSLDVTDFIAWIHVGEQPRTIRDSNFFPTRLLSLQTRQSAAYKGLMALLMKAGCNDFLSGDSIEITSYFDLAIDVHHIFPRDYCDGLYKRSLWNSSINKTPLSAKTNRIIGGKAPSEYLAKIEKNFGTNVRRLDEILQSHKIDPELLRSDQFERFIRYRASQLLDLIETATGKKISGRDSDEVILEYGGILE